MPRRLEPWMLWTAGGLGAAAAAMAGYGVVTLFSSSWPREGDSCSIETYREILGPHTEAIVVDRAWQYMPLARHAARAHGIDPALLAGVVHTESRWNPKAGNAVAQGLTQHIASTAASTFRKLADANKWPFTKLSSSGDPERDGKLAQLGVAEWVDRTDPQQSLWLGAGTLASLQSAGNGETWTLAAYNGGAGNVNEAGPQQYAASVQKRKQWYEALERACGGLFA